MHTLSIVPWQATHTPSLHKIAAIGFPNKFAKIERPEKIKIRAMDENGKKVEIIGKGLLAQAISHEIDHLNGKVFIDKIIPGTLEIVKPEK